MNNATEILAAIDQGDPQAASRLLPLVYDELRRLAAQKLAKESPDQTLQATALVHEAYLRLVATSPASPQGELEEQPRWDNRGHFFVAAAEAMRRILVENARRKHSLKRGGGRKRLDLSGVQPAALQMGEDVLALDEALTKLAEKDAVKAELVKLRFFAGCTGAEAAQLLGISVTTAERYWTYARAWLHREIKGDEDSGK